MTTNHPPRESRLVRIGLLVALVGLASPAFAQDPPPAAAAEAPPAAAPAPAAAAAVPADVLQRIADLEAYVTNGAAKGAPLNTSSGPGHNGWMMVCAALVLFMTLPGLALFYGGLVRAKNILSVLAQCLGCSTFVAVLWWAFGYSMAFSHGSSIMGDMKFAMLAGVTSAPNTDYAYWVSQNVFAMYQLMFAIITPGLIIGAIAERMKYSAIMLFIGLWMVVVYFPMAHMVWGIDGLMNGVWNGDAKIQAIDFAGGTVVHMTSGWTALVLCMVGTGMLWVGWYGFNAGSALAADGVSANAFMTTTLAAATAGLVWGIVEKILKGHASILGICS